ncbi:GAF domain-containing protein [Candidatus Leptofilum sp.]|uniref:GAF domain-containing protein n=1 Tax=Candidatus Leptofilum sp. TaxID=3241576 RepID=UPI003B5BFA77
MSLQLSDSLPQQGQMAHFFEEYAKESKIIFWMADPVTFQITYVSQHANELLGMPDAVWQQPSFWQNHLYPQDKERVLSIFATAVSKQEPQDIEYRLKIEGNSFRWFRDKVCLLNVDDGLRLCGMMTDVTQFKTAVGRHVGLPGYTSFFLEIVQLLSENVEIQQRLQKLAERLCAVFDVTAVYVSDWHLDWSGATYLAYHNAGDGTQSIPATLDAQKFSNLVDGLGWLNEPKPIVTDYENKNLPGWLQERLRMHDAKTILYLPIVSLQEIIGFIILVDQKASHHFSEHDLELGQIIAHQTSIALARARLFQSEARRRREAETLLDVAEFVTSSVELEEILARVIEILRVYLNEVHSCTISTIKDDGLRLQSIFSQWSDDAYAIMDKGWEEEIRATFTAQLAIESGEPIIISDLRQVPFVNAFTAQKIEEGLRSIVCLPLKIQDRILGIMHLHYWHEVRPFSAEEIAVLAGVANQAAIAIENARLFENERRQLHLSQTLQQVGSLLTASLPLDDVYDQIFTLLAEVVSYDSSSLFLFNENKQLYDLVACRGLTDSFLQPENRTLSVQTVHKKIEENPGWAVITDVRHNPDWIIHEPLVSIRAWIGALLKVKGKEIGLLCVESHQVGQYSAEDGRTVAAFANQAAVAIENARLAKETARQAKELAILNQVSRETAVSLNIDYFLEKTTKLVSQELYPDYFGFIMGGDETSIMHPHASYRGLSQKAEQIDIPVHKSITGQVLQHGEPYYAPDVRTDPYYFATELNISSELAIPLLVENDVIGVIHVASPEIDHYKNEDVNFLSTLAGNISAVLERAKLYESQRRQAEHLAQLVDRRTAELKMERDRLFAILESAGEAIILTDTEARIEYANPAMERQSGFTRKELIGQNPRILGNNINQGSTFSEMWENLLSHRSWNGEIINRHKDGKIYDVAVTVTPIINTQGNVTGYVSVQADITHFKEVERLKTEFIANVSHQLRTPLTNIKTYVSLLKKGKPEKFPHYFSVLHFEIDRLARLIQDLLDISRLDAEAEPDPEASADFCDVWDLFWDPFIERAEREHKLLVLNLPDSVRVQMPFVQLEAYELEKILSRMIENALLYTPGGGRIQVAVDWVEGNTELLQLSVCDNGLGVDDEERPFIFDRFFRGDKVIEAGLPGNGLGLAIVREILARHGGKISLERELDEGTCFTAYLPLVLPETIDGFNKSA